MQPSERMSAALLVEQFLTLAAADPAAAEAHLWECLAVAGARLPAAEAAERAVLDAQLRRVWAAAQGPLRSRLEAATRAAVRTGLLHEAVFLSEAAQ